MLLNAIVFFPKCILSWRAKNYVSRQGNVINRRDESTKVTIIIAPHTEVIFGHFVLFPKNCNIQQVDFLYINTQLLVTVHHFPVGNGNSENEAKTCSSEQRELGKNPRSNLAQDSNAPRSQEDSITQFCEEIEDKVTKKLSE